MINEEHREHLVSLTFHAAVTGQSWSQILDGHLLSGGRNWQGVWTESHQSVTAAALQCEANVLNKAQTFKHKQVLLLQTAPPKSKQHTSQSVCLLFTSLAFTLPQPLLSALGVNIGFGSFMCKYDVLFTTICQRQNWKGEKKVPLRSKRRTMWNYKWLLYLLSNPWEPWELLTSGPIMSECF